MKKQTAVEWLQEQLNPDIKTMQGVIAQELLEQAKTMEKEQIEDAYFIGGDQMKNNKYIGMHEYYNETYGGDK